MCHNLHKKHEAVVCLQSVLVVMIIWRQDEQHRVTAPQLHVAFVQYFWNQESRTEHFPALSAITTVNTTLELLNSEDKNNP